MSSAQDPRSSVSKHQADITADDPFAALFLSRSDAPAVPTSERIVADAFTDLTLWNDIPFKDAADGKQDNGVVGDDFSPVKSTNAVFEQTTNVFDVFAGISPPNPKRAAANGEAARSADVDRNRRAEADRFSAASWTRAKSREIDERSVPIISGTVEKTQEPIDSVIVKASAGDYSSIRSCRSLCRKKALLEAAVASWNSDVLVEVVLFLKNTLQQHLFLQVVGSQTMALNVILTYFEDRRDSATLIELYSALNRFLDAGMHMLNLACSNKDANLRLASLGECKSFLEAKLGVENFYVQGVADLHALLMRQISIEERDRELMLCGDAIWTKFPRPNIVGHPVNHLIRYCMLYHSSAQKKKLSNAKGVRNAFRVGAKEWAWMALWTRARAGDWAGVHKLVSKTKFTRKSKCVINFDAFVEACAEFDGSRDHMAQFASMVTDPEERYQLCMHHAIYSVAIQALLSLKDKDRIAKLSDTIGNDIRLGDQERNTLRIAADAALSQCNKKGKWK